MLAVIGVEGSELAEQRLVILRAIDKLDRLGIDGVKQLLGAGRKDDSGDFAKGAGLDEKSIEFVVKYLKAKSPNGNDATISALGMLGLLDIGNDGLSELQTITKLAKSSGYDETQILIDPTVVRGLEYYTGPVFECELLMDAKDEKGHTVRFGSVGGGGRYDDLVSRFIGQAVPATGFSIGVSRLYSALKLLGKTQEAAAAAPVVVLVMDKERQGDYQKMVQQLRQANIRAEMYVGTSGMKAQMKYADKRGAPLVVIQGGDEFAKREVTIKDLRLGSTLASSIESRAEYASQRLAQVSVPEGDLVAEVKKMLGSA
jgi:histidyl-tRNA synthetase